MKIKMVSDAWKHVAAATLLVLAPSLFLAPPVFWLLPRPQLVIVLGSSLSYLLAAYSLILLRRSGQPVPVTSVLMRWAAFFGLWLLGIVIWEYGPLTGPHADYSRPALACALLLGLGAILLTSLTKPGSFVPLAALALANALSLAGHAAYYKDLLPRPEGPEQKFSLVDSSLYQLKLTQYSNAIPDHWRKGGGIAYWGNDYLLVTGDGRMYVFKEEAEEHRLAIVPVPHTVPLDADSFASDAATIFSDTPHNYVESSRFRVSDVAVQELGDRVRILVSHHYWKSEGKCFVLRVSVLEGTAAEILDASAGKTWRTLYDALPCLTLNTTNPRGPRFEGTENGGRMVLLGEHEMLLTVGDQGFDGVNRTEDLPQDPNSAYGKIMRVNLDTGAAAVFTSGHRNPQGLHVAEDGRIWSTEHGPRGGDEINLILEGRNYGWPLATYGTDYLGRHWPLNPHQGEHEGFEQPIYAFVPSIGISALTSIAATPFELWEGDLLVGSLKAQTLFRVRIRNQRVVLAERIAVGHAVRDVIIGHDGRLILWTDDSSIIFVEPTDANDGEALATQCMTCHTFSPYEPSTALGPNLYHVVNRPVAARDDFVYSRAMQDRDGRWSRHKLDEFLARPQAVVPGTTMAFPGISDASQRRLLIDFLSNMSDVD